MFEKKLQSNSTSEKQSFKIYTVLFGHSKAYNVGTNLFQFQLEMQQNCKIKITITIVCFFNFRLFNI